MTAVQRMLWQVLLAFIVKVSADCTGTGTVFTDTTGQLTSPGWPTTNYDNGLECTWFISFTNRYPSIIVTELVMEGSTNLECTADYLEFVSDGNVLLRVCGAPSTFPISVLSTSTVISIKFVTNRFINEKGFSLQWHASTEPGIFVTTTGYNSTTASNGSSETTYLYALFAIVVLAVFITFLMAKRHNNQQRAAAATGAAAAVARRNNAVAAAPPYTVGDPPPPYQQIDDNAPPPEKKHIMISYQWDVKQEVIKLKERLQREGYRVWIDFEQMQKYKTTMQGMAVGVSNAVVVVPVLTSQYTASENCKKELTFAAKNKKFLVPVRMEKKFKPGEDWLGLLLGNTIWYDLSDSEMYEMQMTNFLGALANLGQAATKAPGEGEGDSYEVFAQQQQPTESQIADAESMPIE